MADMNLSTQIEYRPIADFPAYRVGNDGTVWSCWKRVGRKGPGQRHAGTYRVLSDKWYTLKQRITKFGYRRVTLSNGSRNSQRFVHRLMLECFVGLCPEQMETRHLNDVKCDNRLANLAWGTRKENAYDKVLNGHDHLSPETKEKIAKSLLGNHRRHLSGKGYCWHKCKNKWVVHMFGKHFGYYKSESEAAKRASDVKSDIASRRNQ